MAEKIKDLVEEANKEIIRAERSSTYDGEKSALLNAIAKSVTAIAMMFSTDYQKEFGENDE